MLWYVNKNVVRYDNILQVMRTESHKTVRESQSFLTLAQIMHQYKEVLDGDLGTLSGQLHLEIDTSIEPVQEPVRRVPLAIQETLIKELANMEKTGVIKKVDEPTQWISPLVIVKKPNDRLRICMDPKKLNQALRRSHYPTERAKDLNRLPRL